MKEYKTSHICRPKNKCFFVFVEVENLTFAEILEPVWNRFEPGLKVSGFKLELLVRDAMYLTNIQCKIKIPVVLSVFVKIISKSY